MSIIIVNENAPLNETDPDSKMLRDDSAELPRSGISRCFPGQSDAE